MYTNTKIEEPNSKCGLFARLNLFFKKKRKNQKTSPISFMGYNWSFLGLVRFLIIIFIIIIPKTTHPQDITITPKDADLEINSLAYKKSLKNINSTEALFLEKNYKTNFILTVNKEVALKNDLNKVVANTKKVWVTAYSSSFDETDDDPFITASGKLVQDGFVATNILPLGTKIKIPEIFGEKIFVVEDRMHFRKQNVVDIWMESKERAIQFGAYYTTIIILDELNKDDFAKLNLVSKNLD